MVYFPFDQDLEFDRPELACNPAVCDVVLRERVLGPALLLEDVYLVEGHGAVSTAHTEEEMQQLEDACRRVARRIKPFL
jgi:hypothetical protein